MRRLCLALCCSVGLLCAAQPAFASVGHTVEPGETLWSIAAANGFTTRSFAAANGLSPYAQLRVGSVIRVPTVSEAAAALGGRVGAPSSTSSAGSAPGPLGGYAVRYGDTLSAIAGRSGVSVGAIAAMNGLNPDAGVSYLGSLLRSTGDPAMAAAAYYQGLGSVQRVGMLPATRRYVNNVMALRGRFGGP